MNLKTTPEAIPQFIDEKNIKLFTEHKVFTETELRSRYEIHLENYCKVLNIETATMISMSKKYIFPSVVSYLKDLSNTINEIKSAVPDADTKPQEELVKKISSLEADLYNNTCLLEDLSNKALTIADHKERADFYKDLVIDVMKTVRIAADELELITAKKYWPMPTYGDLIYKV